LGLAVANSLEAVRNGATQVECCVNGIGERAGNCSMEEVVMNIHTRKDYFKDLTTGISTKEIYRTSRMVSDLTGLAVQRNKAIVGANAFAHEAGIHQHGILSDKSTYEIMEPSDIGWEGTNIVIGKHSGKHAVDSILKETGYELSQEQIDDILKRIKDLADKQKEVMREDIIAIASDVAGKLDEKEQIVKLDELRINTGNKIVPEAEVTLIVKGKKKTGKAKGDGPVDAASKAIISIVGLGFKLKEYSLKAITGGTDALAHVTITVQDNEGREYKSEGVNEDIIMASVIALIKGINKALNR
ncbi:MAG: 2-isopropylmalate synthase, partial [Nanoarchaeota archaeon]|nr:2-isopropylmalate synthase [Nanoarchaeota archaeon]